MTQTSNKELNCGTCTDREAFWLKITMPAINKLLSERRNELTLYFQNSYHDIYMCNHHLFTILGFCLFTQFSTPISSTYS